MNKSFSIVIFAAVGLGIMTGTHARQPWLKDTSHKVLSTIKESPVKKGRHHTPKKRPAAFRQHTAGLYSAIPIIKTATTDTGKKAAVAQRAIASTVNLIGNMVYADSWSGVQYGLYTIPPSGTGFEKFASFDQNYNYGAIDNGDGLFYGVNYTDFMGYWDYVSFEVWDTQTWTLLSSTEGHYDVMSQGAAVDPSTGDIYGVFHSADGESWNWAKADYENATSIPIAPCNDVYFMSIGADSSGQFYGVGTNKMLYKIDKLTGALSPVGEVDVPYEDFFQGGCVNTQNNTYLQSFCTSVESGLVEIDLTTGASTLLLKFPDHNEFSSLQIGKSVAEDKAPGVPELEVSCPHGAMEALVKLTLPSVFFDETSAAGEQFSYCVLADGISMMEGSAKAGETITKYLPFEKSGIVSFVAKASNNIGESPTAKASCFIGKGAPKAPADVKLKWENDLATLSWQPVTESSDGGYLNPADVTYTVYSADDAQIATVTSTIYTVNVPASEGGLLSYSVRSNYENKNSEKVVSNTVLVGNLTPPFSMDFTDEGSFAIHSVLDANGDGKSWWYNLGACYTYSELNQADDWIFSPGIILEEGKAYKVSARVREHHGSYVERIEILIGRQSEPVGMTDVLVPPTDIVSIKAVELGDYFIPETTGLYYIGFHALSNENEWNLYVESYDVSAPVEGSQPAMVTDASVTPDPDGYLNATVKFTAPSTNVMGLEYKGNITVKVFRDESMVGEVSLRPGESSVIIDRDIPEPGAYTYTFTTYAADGTEGQTVKVESTIGPKTPEDIDPESVKLIETAPGTYRMSWTPIENCIDGTPIKQGNIIYKVYSTVEEYGNILLGDELATVAEPEFDYTPEPFESQRLLYLCVRPFNLSAPSQTAASASVVAGPAYEMPVRYSNESDLKNYFLLYGGDGSLRLFNSSSVPGLKPQDDDNAYLVIENGGLDQTTYILTGKIAVTGDNPVFSFHIFSLTGLGDKADANTTTVSIISDGVEHSVSEISHSKLEAAIWNKITVPLADYSGKNIQVKLAGTCHNYAYNVYDNLKIHSEPAHDVSARINSPSTVNTGKDFDIRVTVANEGREKTGEINVALYCDGTIADSKKIKGSLDSGKEAEVVFTRNLGIHSPEEVSFKAVAEMEGDMNPTNNATKLITVTRKIQNLPVVTGLRGDVSEEGVSLAWDPVVIEERKPETITEDFETGTPYAAEFADWAFVDMDKSPVGGFTGVEFPGITTGVTLGSFFIFDDVATTIFEAKSGHQFLASLVRYDDGKADDWAISPELPGTAQTISFFAKSYSASYKEEIEIYYSLSDRNPSSFIPVTAFGTKEVPDEWTEFMADIPEGAKYFAIRSCATGGFVLLIDDVTFTKLNGFAGVLSGYNLYCDAVKVNDGPIKDTTCLHAPESGTHVYHVTALYDLGESELSAPLSVETSGIRQAIMTGASVRVHDRSIIVSGSGEAPVIVSTLDAKVIYRGKGDTEVTVEPGTYLVTVNSHTSKVAVF